MKFNSLPSQEYLHTILFYNEETGIFKWKYRSDAPKKWNTRYAESIAGTLNSNGYLSISINYMRYRAHRLAWVYVYGDVLNPYLEIDHKNRNRAQNSIANLRLADKSQNGGNSIGKSRCGLPKGVEKNKSKFTARIMKNRKRVYLGTYNTPEEAHRQYMKAAHVLQKEFARGQ